MNQVTKFASNVFKTLGSGFSESVYHNALCVELRRNGIQYDTERVFPILYHNQYVGVFRPDLVINPNRYICDLMEKKIPEIDNHQVTKEQLEITNNQIKNETFIVELKAISKVREPEFTQLRNYLKHKGISKGLLINFPSSSPNEDIESWEM